MMLPLAAQRCVERPISAGAPMPADLHVPHIALPGTTHRGTRLNRLGDPHAPESPGHLRDIAITRELLAQRSEAGDAWARAMDRHGATAVWRELAVHVAGHEQAAVQTLVGAALAAASTQAGIGKRRWQRQRPYQLDPSIDVVGRTPRPGDSSYPSAHAARAFAAARVIARLDPTLEPQAWQLAREVAISRIYAGVHFASDVIAGARLGIAAAESVLARRDTILGAATINVA
ncbi:MAG: phosphatase PAP2 family protein [Thermoleophilia bacterium]|nr:phosphatase PAP2 family protein [Thermoleophilia bacterium]